MLQEKEASKLLDNESDNRNEIIKGASFTHHTD